MQTYAPIFPQERDFVFIIDALGWMVLGILRNPTYNQKPLLEKFLCRAGMK